MCDGDFMEKVLQRLLEDARKNPQLKDCLIKTKLSADPMKEFCDVCTSLGYPVYLGELFALGQDMNDSKLRSVNGGGVNGIDGWDDAYEMFMAALTA